MAALEAMVGAMTVGDFARFAGCSIADVVAAAVNGSRVSSHSTTTAEPPGRVARGGLQLDAVLAALVSVGGPAKLEDVRAKVGGSAAQVRAALQKLASARRVAIEGERRGTRYVAR